MGSGGGEAVVVCSDKSMVAGITIWNIDTGDRLLHIPTCASPARGLVCLRSQVLVAAQIHKPGSVGGGAISMWNLNKPQKPIQSYPLEAIGPLSSTKNGLYLAGGALSGELYLWEVTNGKMLKTWRGHDKSLSCMLFSDDGSLLVSGSDDGMISVWNLISGSVTALTFSKSGLISASQDCTICIWDTSSCEIIRRFNHQKVIPQSSLLPVSNHRKNSNAFGVSVLDKYPQPANSSNEKITLFSPCHSLEGNQISINFQTTDFAAQQIQNMEKDSIAAMEMKLETCPEGRMRATKMVKHVMEMNRHLQSHLLDLMESRLLSSRSSETDSSSTRKSKTYSSSTRKSKTFMLENPPLQEGEEQP